MQPFGAPRATARKESVTDSNNTNGRNHTNSYIHIYLDIEVKNSTIVVIATKNNDTRIRTKSKDFSRADNDITEMELLACPRTGLLARRAKPLERAWIKVVREAVGPEGQVVPQQWLVRTPAPGVDPDDRWRLDFVAYGATQLGEALCCDVTLVSPLTRDGRPQPSSTTSACRPGHRRNASALQARCLPTWADCTKTSKGCVLADRVFPDNESRVMLLRRCLAPRRCHCGVSVDV